MAKETPEQNVNFQVTGAEKLVGVTAALQDFSSVLQQLLSNPLGGGYVARRAHDMLMDNFVKPMKEFKNLTKEQQFELDKLVARSRNLTTIAGVITSLVLGMTELVRSTRVASAELGRFFSLDNLPGGAKTLYRGQLNLQKETLLKSLEYNEAFAKDYEDIYKELARKIKADMPNADDLKIKDLIEQLAILQKGTGVSIQPFVQLRDSLESFGIEIEDVTYLYKLLISETVAKGGKFQEFSPQEIIELFIGAVLNRRGGTLPQETIRQTLTLAETYGPIAGPRQIEQLQTIIPGFQNELENNMKAQTLFGITPSMMRGTEGAVNIVNSLIKFMHKQTGGKPQANIMDMFRKSAYGVVVPESVGLDKDMLQLLNSLKEVKDASTSVADSFDKWGVKKNLLDDTDKMKQTIGTMEKSLWMSSNIFELIGNLGKYGVAQFQTGLSNLTGGVGGQGGVQIPEWAIQGGILAGSSLFMGRRLTGGLRKGMQTLAEKIGQQINPSEVNAGLKHVPWGQVIAEKTPVAGEIETALTTSTRVARLGTWAGRVFWPTLLGTMIYVIGNELLSKSPEEIARLSRATRKFGPKFTFPPPEKGPTPLDALQTNTLQGLTGADLILPGELYGDPKAIEQGKKLRELRRFKQRLGATETSVFSPETIAPSWFSNSQKREQWDTTDDLLNLVKGSKVTKGEEIKKEGEGKDFGTLNVIFSNDKGDILAQTTVDNQMKQTAIRIAISSEIGIG
jgi:hypothetical protein